MAKPLAFSLRIGFILLLTPTLSSGSPSFTPVLPPSYPLAVRNPYLSAWLPGNQTQDLPSAVPQFWNGDELTWSFIARIDGQVFSLLGVPDPGSGVRAASLQGAEYTSTHTAFTLDAGSATIVLDFFSPISPKNDVRQSLPFSYVTVSASGKNGASPSVQVYSDIDNSWAGQFGQYVSTTWNWALTPEDAHVFTIGVGGGQKFVEVNDRAQWGRAVYCTQHSASILTEGVGDSEAIRAAFGANGSLIDSDWEWQAGSVVAFSHQLGQVGKGKTVTFAIGYDREVDVVYRGEDRSAYWRSQLSDLSAGCVHFLSDFDSADAEARDLDVEVASKAESVGGEKYKDIVTLSARRVFGALDLTIPADTLDANDLMVFVKEISSNGNVNTVDVIMPISPIWFVLAPEYIRLTLEPVMRYLASGAWPHNYTIHDIGTHYPNATGHDDGKAQEMPVEECANILILTLMYQRASGDSSWVQQYSSLFRQAADYLVDNGLYPTAQFSSDDGAGVVANQTGLAIKAAIGLTAYGKLSNQTDYYDVGRALAHKLFVDSVGTDKARTHFTLLQGEDNSWTLAYNLYLDILLKLDTFPESAHVMATKYYPSVRADAGVPLDSRVNWAKTDWMHFAAATALAVGNDGVKDMFVDDVHAFVTNGQNDAPFSDNFFSYTNGSDAVGNFNTYRARPVVGGHFALMALGGPNQIDTRDGNGKRDASEGGNLVMRTW